MASPRTKPTRRGATSQRKSAAAQGAGYVYPAGYGGLQGSPLVFSSPSTSTAPHLGKSSRRSSSDSTAKTRG